MEDAPITNQEPVAQDDAPVASAGDSSGRPKPALGWAVAVGALSVALLVAIGVAAFAWYSYSSMSGPTTVEVMPVEAGQQWFAVSQDGTGILEGWPYGSSGSDDENTYYFDVYEVGSVGDVPIQHVANVYVDEKTEFYVGNERYEPKGSVSRLDSIFGMSGEDPEGFLYGDMKLRVDFHTVDGRIIADRVTAQPGSQPDPMLQ